MPPLNQKTLEKNNSLTPSPPTLPSNDFEILQECRIPQGLCFAAHTCTDTDTVSVAGAQLYRSNTGGTLWRHVAWMLEAPRRSWPGAVLHPAYRLRRKRKSSHHARAPIHFNRAGSPTLSLNKEIWDFPIAWCLRTHLAVQRARISIPDQRTKIPHGQLNPGATTRESVHHKLRADKQIIFFFFFKEN